MNINIYQIDAFATSLFTGNPAAVCLLETWLEDTLLQSIASENNLSETAFITTNSDHSYNIRWFTPNGEVDLCGHATLAAAFVLNEIVQVTHQEKLTFHSKSRGKLFVTPLEDSNYQLDFPALEYTEITETPDFINYLSIKPKRIYVGLDYLLEYEKTSDIENLIFDPSSSFSLDARGIIITAPGKTTDCISRCFYPTLNVPEDPVTGSAHCMIVPFWAKKLNKNSILAFQASPRQGLLKCELKNSRVLLSGKTILYMHGTIYLEGKNDG